MKQEESVVLFPHTEPPDQKFLDGTSPRIYPWNQSQIANRKSSSPRIDPWGQSKIENLKSQID
jgi:hypothetical protein